jgi:hypothetical protein
LLVHFEAATKEIIEDGLLVTYNTIEQSSEADPVEPLAVIACSAALAEEVTCEFVTSAHPAFPASFSIPVGNLGSNRFFGEDQDGQTVEGFRVEYD